jgi:hypothetical protein
VCLCSGLASVQMPRPPGNDGLGFDRLGSLSCSVPGTRKFQPTKLSLNKHKQAAKAKAKQLSRHKHDSIARSGGYTGPRHWSLGFALTFDQRARRV